MSGKLLVTKDEQYFDENKSGWWWEVGISARGLEVRKICNRYSGEEDFSQKVSSSNGGIDGVGKCKAGSKLINLVYWPLERMSKEYMINTITKGNYLLQIFTSQNMLWILFSVNHSYYTYIYLVSGGG